MIMLLGSNFCSSKNDSRVEVKVSFVESTLTEITEVEEYPLLQLVNELAGFAGLCFGISLLSSISLFQLIDARIPHKNSCTQLQLTLLKYLK